MTDDLHNERLLTAEQVAEVTGLSYSHLAALRRNGMGPAFFKLGTGPKSAVRYRPSDVRAWIEARVTNGPARGADR